MVTRLAIWEIGGKEYFKDERLREFRNVENPHEKITFEEYNRKKDMKGKEILEKKVI